MSSAYCEIKYCSPSILIPFILFEFRIVIASSSAHKIKIYGDKESPCLEPLSNLKDSDKNPFYITHERELL